VTTAPILRRQHGEACFTRAFPDSRTKYDEAHSQLRYFESQLAALPKRQGARLDETGIVGTRIHYCFSFDVARWLARSSPGLVIIDWPELGDCEPLDNLLRQVLQPSEDEYFDSGYADTKEWVGLASAGHQGTDFDWLMAQLGQKRFESIWRQLYDAAEVPLVWDLSRSRYSISRNILPTASVVTREDGMRPRPRNAKKEIQRPIASIPRLSKREGARMINAAMASLAARHRETYHFNFANPEEVYLADVGEGVAVAVFGLQAAHRFPLECTMGYLILSNGVPIGYGGASLLFKQVNTGVNIFDDYRGSEAAYLWVQVMRVYHSLVGCTRFIANAYQLGHENSEALQSGAFWFYYHLGYRPVSRDVRKTAVVELAKRHRDGAYRSGQGILKTLASCDMHLTLPGSRQSEFFDEEWLSTLSKLATRELGQISARTRRESIEVLSKSVARSLRMRSMKSWTQNEKRSMAAIAPFITACDPDSWSDSTRRAARQILRAKGGQCELNYACLICHDSDLLAYFRAACQREEGLRVSAPH
jgi:hypothetical protein